MQYWSQDPSRNPSPKKFQTSAQKVTFREAKANIEPAKIVPAEGTDKKKGKGKGKDKDRSRSESRGSAASQRQPPQKSEKLCAWHQISSCNDKACPWRHAMTKDDAERDEPSGLTKVVKCVIAFVRALS